LKRTVDTTSRAYHYLNWKIQYASCQIYDFDNWSEVEGGLGMFNPQMNELIGPESNISWAYMLKFFWYQRQFNRGRLDSTDTKVVVESPINFLPEIKAHPYPITYLLGRYESSDMGLHLYDRYLADIDPANIHIFEQACHNIWMDQPEAFQEVLAAALRQATNHAITELEEPVN
jgi:pimeloyl-ACP methyl ester carboxylesterase